MALTAGDYIRPLRNLNDGVIPLITVSKEATTTWSKGTIIVASSGYAVAAATGAEANTVLGVAAHDAVEGKTEALIYPALPNISFWGRIALSAGATVDSAVTHRYVATGWGVGYYADAGICFVNVEDTTTGVVQIVNLIDPAGTEWGAVEFVFKASALVNTPAPASS
jgi:hypothetical protein